MKNFVLIFLVVIVAATIAFVAWQENQEPPEEINLKLQLKAGESREMKLTSSQKITQTVKDQQHRINVRAEMVIGFDVLNVDSNGAMDVELFYKAMKLKTDDPEQKADFDSANPKPIEPNEFLERAVAEVFSAVIGNKLSMKISPAGQTSDIKGFEPAIAKYEVAMAKYEEELNKRPVMDMNNINPKSEEFAKKMEKIMAEHYRLLMLEELCKSIFSSLVMDTREMVDCIIMKFPDGRTSVGCEWQGKSWLNMGFLAVADTTYKFKRRENGRVYIDAISDLDMGKDLRIMKITSREKQSKRMSGARTSSNIVDEATGLLQRSEAISRFSGIEKIEPDKATLPIRPDMTIQIGLEGSTVIELIK